MHSFSYAQGKWSLEKCVNYAIENNIQIKQQKLNTEYNSNNLFQSKMGVLPNINGSASHSYSFGRALDESTYEFTDNQKTQSNSFGLNASVNLFAGLQTVNTIKQNSYNYLASIKDLEKTINDISLSIALGYLQILFSKELLEIAKNQIDITLQQVERTTQLYEAGSVAHGKLLEIQAQAAAEELQVVNAQNQLDISYLNLTQMLDLDSVGNFEIEFPELNVKEEDELLRSVNSIYTTAKGILPEIKGSEYRLKSSERGLAIANGALSPRLSASF